MKPTREQIRALEGMSLSEEIIEQETYIDLGKTIRRYRYIGDDLLSDRVAELEQELAETTAEQNHRGDKIRELLKESERLKAALKRLSSMEAFTLSRMVTAHDDELIARIEYAADVLDDEGTANDDVT